MAQWNTLIEANNVRHSTHVLTTGVGKCVVVRKQLIWYCQNRRRYGRWESRLQHSNNTFMHHWYNSISRMCTYVREFTLGKLGGIIWAFGRRSKFFTASRWNTVVHSRRRRGMSIWYVLRTVGAFNFVAMVVHCIVLLVMHSWVCANNKQQTRRNEESAAKPRIFLKKSHLEPFHWGSR